MQRAGSFEGGSRPLGGFTGFNNNKRVSKYDVVKVRAAAAACHKA